MKIITFNCFGPPFSAHRHLRFSKLAQQLKAIQPDIVNLQEIFFQADRSLIEKAIPDYHFTHKHRLGQGGTLIITKKDIGKSIFVPFKDQGSFISTIDRLAPKGFRYLEDKKTNTFFINVHLLNIYRNLNSEIKTVESQLKQLTEFVLSLSKATKIVLSGDFNLCPNSQKMTDFIKNTGLVDSSPPHQKSHCPENLVWKFKMFNRLSRSGILSPHIQDKYQKLDYILFKNLSQRVHQDVIFDTPFLSTSGDKYFISDHFGLLATIA